MKNSMIRIMKVTSSVMTALCLFIPGMQSCSVSDEHVQSAKPMLTRSPVPYNDSTIIQGLEDLMITRLGLSSMADLDSDLTDYQKSGLVIDPDSAELYTLNPYAFGDYARRYKSTEFCRIYNGILRGTEDIPDVDAIVSNTELSLHEQFILGSVAIVNEETARVMATDVEPDKQKICMRNFVFNKARCLGIFIAESAVVVAGAVTTGGIGLLGASSFAVAAAQFENCCRIAEQTYINCIK